MILHYWEWGQCSSIFILIKIKKVEVKLHDLILHEWTALYEDDRKYRILKGTTFELFIKKT